MRNIWRIFVEDLKSLKMNVIAAVVAVGLLITPPLYAWFNILGFWDPYGATDNLEVAVANADAGYQSDLFPTKINAGAEIEADLRTNDEFEWIFTTESEAIEGVKSGEYYAALVIPEQFSADLLTIFSDQTRHADIIYYTNEKENAVAPKVTAEGANTVSVAINQTFTRIVASVSLDTASDLVNFVNGDGISNYGRNLNQHLATMITDLELAETEVKALYKLVQSTAAVSKTAAEVLEGLGGTNEAVPGLLATSEVGMNDGLAALGAASGSLNQLTSQLDEYQKKLDELAEKLEAAGGALGPEGLVALGGTDLAGLKDELQQKITTAKDALTDYQKQLAARMDQLTADFGQAKGTILGLNDRLGNLTRNLAGSAESLASSLDAVEQTLASTAGTLAEAKNRLTEVQGRLQTALDSGDLVKLREILGTNTAEIAEFVAAPTVLNRQPVYEVANNGSAFSPFYTSLSIWVGAVFMVALAETVVGPKRKAELKDAKPHQLYWGRYLTFLLFSLTQATVVCLGDIFFVGIQCQHVGLFLLAGWVCALVFSNIVYTLTLSFGRVGECLAIILLVLQIAASGGIFPVVLSADFFQVMNPFLPFTYSLPAFQGAVAGIYGDQYWQSIGALLVFMVPMLVIGLVLRRPIITLNDKVVEKLGETRLM